MYDLHHSLVQEFLFEAHPSNTNKYNNLFIAALITHCTLFLLFQRRETMATNSADGAAATARNKVEEARKEVMEYEKKMQAIKEALRGIAAAATPASASDGDEGEENKDTNSLKISALKVCFFIVIS